MNFNDHLSAARTVLAEFGTYIEKHSHQHAFPITSLPYEKLILKNAIIISALEDRSEENIEFCRLGFHIIATSVADIDASFINEYFRTITRGDLDQVNALDVNRWNKLRADIHREFVAYEIELRQLLTQVATLHTVIPKDEFTQV